MDNSCLMSFSDLSRAAGGRLFFREGERAADPCLDGFSSIGVDSRNVLSGGLFVALCGNSLDGHRFVESAFRAGARGAMVAVSALKDPVLDLAGIAKKWKKVLVAVEDTLKGLQDAARVYISRFEKLTRIGITGSSGKTTTKEIAAAIIGQEKKVVMNRGNLNSETGLPLSVFEVRGNHEFGIFEAGMNRKGEIAELAKVLNPDFALITNTGSAHIGILGSRRAIAEEKKNIFCEFSGDNTALIPEDDDFRDFLAEGVKGRKVFYGRSSLPSIGGIKDLGLLGTDIIWDGEVVRFGLPGKFNLRNALAAASLALEIGVSSASVRRGLESVKPLFGRGEIIGGRVTVIRDCYNSNPESAAAAVDFCDSLEWKGRKIYVIGSMLELGEVSADAHAALGRRLSSCGASMVFLFGGETKSAACVMEESVRCPGHLSEIPFFFTEDMNELKAALEKYVKAGDIVLLKGSRGCALEKLTETLAGNTVELKGANNDS